MPIDDPVAHADHLRQKDHLAFSNVVANLARHYTHTSATVALNLSLLLAEDVEWTENL